MNSDLPGPSDFVVPTGDGAPPYSGSFPSASPGFSQATLQVAGFSRKVTLYLPQQLPANAPLVIALHGTDGNAKDNIWAIEADQLADAEGVVIAAPQARTMTTGDWDDHEAGQVFYETYPSVDAATNPDLLLVQAIIAEAVRVYGVDSKRVYTMGFSNGAFFSILCAAALPHRIAGFAEMSGGLVRCSTMGECAFFGSGTSCAALSSQSGYCSCSGAEKPGPLPTGGRKPAGYLVHRADDTVVSPYYSCQLAARMEQLGYPHTVKILSSGGHEPEAGFASKAWAYLSQHRLP